MHLWRTNAMAHLKRATGLLATASIVGLDFSAADDARKMPEPPQIVANFVSH